MRSELEYVLDFLRTIRVSLSDLFQLVERCSWWSRPTTWYMRIYLLDISQSRRHVRDKHYVHRSTYSCNLPSTSYTSVPHASNEELKSLKSFHGSLSQDWASRNACCCLPPRHRRLTQPEKHFALWIVNKKSYSQQAECDPQQTLTAQRVHQTAIPLRHASEVERYVSFKLDSYP